jgi:hypothetical protein
MTKRPRGRPTGYVAPDNFRVTDPQAFVTLFRLLREHAAPQSRGGASALAYVLDVSHVLVIQYCRKAPRAIAPQLWAALERAPLMLQRYPFDFDAYFALLERAVDGREGQGTAAPHTGVAWLPNASAARDLADELGPTIHSLRSSRRVSASTVRALPCGVWLRCTVSDSQVIEATLNTMSDRTALRSVDDDAVLLLLQEPV